MLTAFGPTDLVAIMDPLTPSSAIEFSRDRRALADRIHRLEGRRGVYLPPRSAAEEAAARSRELERSGGRGVPGTGVGERHQGRRRTSSRPPPHISARCARAARRMIVVTEGIARRRTRPRHVGSIGHGRQAGHRAGPAGALGPGDAPRDRRSEHRPRHGPHRQRQQHRRARPRSPRPDRRGRLGVDARNAGVRQRRRAAPVQRPRRVR